MTRAGSERGMRAKVIAESRPGFALAFGHGVETGGRLEGADGTSSTRKKWAQGLEVGVTLRAIEDNLAAASVTLTEAQVKTLDTVSEPGWGYPYDLIGGRERW